MTIRVPHTEMGQGGMTSVAQLVAEELNVPWQNVRAVLADANRNVTRGNEYKDMSTGGSNLVRNRHPHIMQAGASARERLKEAAAQKWGVKRSEVKAEQGILTAGSNRGTYGEFATAAAAIKLAEEPKIKAYGDWWLLGKDVPRMDVAAKVNGSAIYPIDVRLPGMVYAAVRACPVPGGKLKSFDAAAIKDRPGVVAVIELKQTKEKLGNTDLRSAIAVVADSFYRAKVALDLMPVQWDLGSGVETSYAKMDTMARDLMGKEAKHAEEVRGDPRPILAAADKVVVGDYARPYDTHVPMSTPAAVADVKPDRVDVWSFTQNVQATLLLAAEQAGRDPKTVFVHGTFQGGAFGLGNAVDVSRQAVEHLQAGRTAGEGDLDPRGGYDAGARPPAHLGAVPRRARQGRTADRDAQPRHRRDRRPGLCRSRHRQHALYRAQLPLRAARRPHQHPDRSEPRAGEQLERLRHRAVHRRGGDRRRVGPARMAAQDDRGQ